VNVESGNITGEKGIKCAGAQDQAGVGYIGDDQGTCQLYLRASRFVASMDSDCRATCRLCRLI